MIIQIAKSWNAVEGNLFLSLNVEGLRGNNSKSKMAKSQRVNRKYRPR